MAGTRRVILLIFDGLDANQMFGERLAALPAFGRLRRESVVFERAEPPAGRRTVLSIPSYLSGRAATFATPSGRDDLAVRFADGSSVERWRDQQTLFDIARGHGLPTTIVGWALPYCRIFGARVTDCTWRPFIPTPHSLARAVERDLQIIRYSVPGVYRFTWHRGRLHEWSVSTRTYLRWHQESYRTIHAAFLGRLRTRATGFFYAHYPVPHDPFILDRRRDAFVEEQETDYEGNVLLADRALADVLGALDHVDTTLVVTSDHAPKHLPSEGFVPLLVRFPGGKETAAIAERVDAVRVFDLVQALLHNRVRTAADAVALVRR